MRENGLHSNIYIDPLTELPNFFRFLEMDFEKQFDENGAIIVLDLANFRMVNETLGRNIGDFHLKSLSDSIRLILSEYANASIFRTHGDEFTIIIPRIHYAEALEIARSIKYKYCKVINEYGYSNCELHTLVMNYNSSISSIEKYYQLLIQSSSMGLEYREPKFNGSNLFSHIIDGVINRVKDTISYYNDAYNLALIDDISGVPNHRAGQMYLTELMNEYQSQKMGFSILFIDGDNLKRYNNISYEAGNKMIRELSQIISNTLRNEDRIYRWLSGDEFLVIINETNIDNVYKIAERIRENVEEQTKAWTYPITVSIGISSYQREDCSIDTIINQAEKANSLAKNTGKNKIVVWNTLS